MTMAKCHHTGAPVHLCRCGRHETIGGRLSAAGYAALATRHKPVYRDGMAAAARDLAASGLKANDIASALGITAAAVDALLQRADVASGDEAAQLHANAWAGNRGEP